MKALLVIAVLMAGSVSHAMVSCEFHINELSTKAFVETAATADAALDKAATKCFDMYDELSQRRKGHALEADEAGYTVANNCTNNVRCH